MINNLVGVCKTSHTTHDAKDIVVGCVNADLGGCGTTDGSSGNNQLKGCVINSTEVTGSRWLVFFWAKSERVNVDTGVGVAGVVVERLNEIEVCAFAFREAILAIEL